MDSTKEIRFFVPGVPRPGGSKRVFPIRKGGIPTGKFIVTDAAGQKNKDWRASVAHEAKATTFGEQVPDGNGGTTAKRHDPWTCPIELELRFVLPRPKGHFRNKLGALPRLIMAVHKVEPVEVVKPGAPKYPTSRPDCGKLARSTTDALTHILWVDDAQIIKETHSKEYGAQPGCWVTVKEAI